MSRDRMAVSVLDAPKGASVVLIKAKYIAGQMPAGNGAVRSPGANVSARILVEKPFAFTFR
jgi:hypothetical protein